RVVERLAQAGTADELAQFALGEEVGAASGTSHSGQRLRRREETTVRPDPARRWLLVVLAAVAVSAGPGAAAMPAPAATTSARPSCPWLNQSLPVRSRVSRLLASMTLSDKITMVEGQGTSKPYVFYTA